MAERYPEEPFPERYKGTFERRAEYPRPEEENYPGVYNRPGVEPPKSPPVEPFPKHYTRPKDTRIEPPPGYESESVIRSHGSRIGDIYDIVWEDVPWPQCVRKDSFKWQTTKPREYFCGDSISMLELCNREGKEFVLKVDYQDIIDYKYAGTEKPPYRDFDLQFDDWSKGYMLGRFHLAQNCSGSVPEDAPGYWYWVKYRAYLYEMVADPDVAILELKLLPFMPGALDGFKSNIATHVSEIATRLPGWNVEAFDLTGDTLKLVVSKEGTLPIGYQATESCGCRGTVGSTVVTDRPVGALPLAAIPAIPPLAIIAGKIILATVIVVGLVIGVIKTYDYLTRRLISEDTTTAHETARELAEQGFTPEQIAAIMAQVGTPPGAEEKWETYVKWGMILAAAGIAVNFLAPMMKPTPSRS